MASHAFIRTPANEYAWKLDLSMLYMDPMCLWKNEKWICYILAGPVLQWSGLLGLVCKKMFVFFDKCPFEPLNLSWLTWRSVVGWVQNSQLPRVQKKWTSGFIDQRKSNFGNSVCVKNGQCPVWISSDLTQPLRLASKRDDFYGNFYNQSFF